MSKYLCFFSCNGFFEYSFDNEKNNQSAEITREVMQEIDKKKLNFVDDAPLA